MNKSKFKNPAQILSRANNTPFNPEVVKQSRRRTCPQGEAVNTVSITYCVGYERFCDQPQPKVVGGFATMGIGRYLE